MKSKRLIFSQVGNLLIFLINLLLIIDCINGLCLGLNINFPISVIYKTILLISTTIWLCNINEGRKIVFIIVFYISILYLFDAFIGIEITPTITHLFKFLLTVIIYFFLKFFSEIEELYLRIHNLLQFNAFILLINILAIVLGIGFTSYSGAGMTSKGFFYAANEVSGLFLILCPISLYFYIDEHKGHWKKALLFFFIITYATLLLGSKTAIVGVLLLNIIIIQLMYREARFIKWLKLLVIIAITICIYKGLVFIEKWGLWQRWIYFYEKGGWEKVLFSDRDLYWEEEKTEILNGSIDKILMGLGEARTVEMDIFDAFLNYGILGIIIIYGFYAYMIYNVCKIRRLILAKIVLYVDIAFLIFSSIGGHMVFSGMASPFIAVLNILPIIYSKYLHGIKVSDKIISIK